MFSHARTATGLAVLLIGSAVCAQQQQVFRTLGSEQLENILTSLEIKFRKSPSRKAGDFYYDYERHFFKIRLHDFGGKDIMLDAIFTKTPVEVLNAWNGRAKFSRAVLHKPAAGQEYAALEANLDILGGVTEETIRHFIRTFDNEIKLYDRFIGEYGQTDKVVTIISDEMVEEALKVLGIPIKKTPG